FFFRRVINFVVAHPLCSTLERQHFGDGGGQGCLTMIYVTDGADVDMRLVSFKLGHFSLILFTFVFAFIQLPAPYRRKSNVFEASQPLRAVLGNWLYRPPLITSSAMLAGAVVYFSNSMLKLPRPCVILRRLVA